jgi:hypothetical protein
MTTKKCDCCKKEKPESEFIKLTTNTKVTSDGSVKNYVYRETTCTPCRKKDRSEYMRKYREKKPRIEIFKKDLYGFVFSDKLERWIGL